MNRNLEINRKLFHNYCQIHIKFINHDIGQYIDAVGLALRRQSALQVTPPPPPCLHLKAPIKGGVFHRLVVEGRDRCQKVLYSALTLS